jgi:hypothetical protein
MSRIVSLSLAFLFVSIGFACAQQAPSTEAQRKVTTLSDVIGLPAAARAQRSANQPKASTHWPPNPYQPSRSEIEAMARAKEEAAIQAARQVSPSLVDLSDGRRREAAPQTRIIVDPQLDARSKVIFPRAAYDADQEALRMQWIVDHEQQATANEINRAKPLLYPVSGR